MRRPLVLLPEVFRTAGGVQTYGRMLLRAFCDIAGENPAGPQFLLLNDRARDVDPLYVGGGAKSVAAFGGSRLRFALGALRAAVVHRPDLVLLGHLNFAPLVPLLRRLCPGVSLWAVLYGIEAWRPISRRHRRWLSLCDRFVSISLFTRERAVSVNGLDPERFLVLPGAVDPVWAAALEGADVPLPPLAPSGCWSLLTVTRLRASDGYKGVDLVIDALPGITASFPQARYVVIGDGDDRARLEARARGLAPGCLVEFRGRVSQQALTRAYEECHLLVLPSRGEGFGLVHAEAAWLGRPAIGARDGATPEVIEDGVTGRLVSGDDPAELATVVRQLLSEPRRLAIMGEAARSRARRRFAYDAFVRDLGAAVAGAGGPRLSIPGRRA